MKVLNDTFNKQAHKNKLIIEQALKSSVPKLKKEVAISLSYYRGADRLSLFEKALTHEDPSVRQHAAFSLFYWNRSDQNTLQMLVKLLNHSTSKVRQEVASLIKVLYPIAQNKKEKKKAGSFFLNLFARKKPPLTEQKKGLLDSYIVSGCSQPISEVISSKDIEGILSVFNSSSEDSNEPQPIIPLPTDDPRVTQEFASLGKMIQVGGVIWSGVAPKKMKPRDAEKYCKSLGAKLPTDEEWESMGQAMGYKVPGRTYDSNLVSDTYGRLFWSSSGDPNYPDFAFAFDGKNGDVGSFNRISVISVRCVEPLRGESDLL